MRLFLIRAEIDLITRAMSELISMADLDLMPMVCMDCGRVYEVKDAEGKPGVGHGLCRTHGEKRSARAH